MLTKIINRSVRNYSKELSKHYGGTWKYDSYGCWQCDDGIRHVDRVHACSCDDVCDHPPAYYLYGAGTPEQVIF